MHFAASGGDFVVEPSSGTNTPNIVFIVADQWRGDCLGFLENDHPVMTPHIDQLADEGVAFPRAYADCPICMPQRATVLTGKTASRLGLATNFACRTPIVPELSLAGLLASKKKYQTEAVGKMHMIPERARFGFDNITLHPNDYVNWLEETDYAGSYRGHGLGGNEVFPTVAATPERFTHTHWIVDNGIRFLERRDPEVPFFMYMVFEAPHSPFDPPEPFDRMYDRFAIPDPVWGDWAEHTYPRFLENARLSKKSYRLNEEMIREARRRYYGQISHIDYQLGRLFGELKTRGLYEDTIIVFTSDHGEHLGDHGIFGKTTFLSGSADVPLIFRVPSQMLEQKGTFVNNTPALTADIYTTLLDFAGIEPPEEIDGISLKNHICRGQEEDRIIHGEFEGNHGTAFATDGRYKFIYYANGGLEQLFDVEQDPKNLVNLAAEPHLQTEQERLRASLVSYLQQFGRPLAVDGRLKKVDEPVDPDRLRRSNPCAWRGPMRYGQGYYG